MKILLAAVNAKYIHSNLAVYSLRAYARKYQEEIRIAEYTINQTVDEILMDIYIKRPDVLCFSCYLWNITCVAQILAEVPKILPGIKIWLGGPEVSYDAVTALERHPGVEGIMYGEGEATFLELAECWHGEKSLSGIEGIVYREESGKIQENPPRPVLDLSTIPFAYDRIEDFKNRIIYYESSRGCPFSCSYCLSSIDKCLRFRDVGMVKEELQFLIDREVPQVKFVDRTFNCRHGHAMEIWTYIKEHDRGITNFHFEAAADLLSDEEISLIRSMRPGLIQLEIGVQTVNEAAVKEIRRTMNLDKVRSRVAEIRAGRNVHQHLDLIAGLPEEGYESFARSFDMVYAMKPEQLQLGFLKVLKGSLMHEKAREYGLLYQDRPPYEVLSTKWLSYGEIVRLKRVEEMVEIYYNSGQFRHTLEYLERKFSSPFQMYEALAEYYKGNGLLGVQHSRIARYEIISRFAVRYMEDEAEQKECMEWLTLDLYLRDNVKNRPAFLRDNQAGKETAAAFYKKEAQELRYLKGYEGCDGRQLRKMTHLERLGGKLLLFDYRKRDPLTGDAAVYEIEEKDQ